MNERIKQLALQAGNYVNEVYTGPVRSKTPGKIWEDGHIGWQTLFNKKFAELIVRECAEQVKNLRVNGYGISGAEIIRKHFRS
jgi:hypothetical protein